MTTSGFDLRSIGLRRGSTAVLDAVTLHLPPGARTAIVGPSGAGKSTLLRLLAGFDAPTNGEILLDGVVVSRSQEVLLPPHRRSVSMLFQDLALWPNLSALANVMLALSGTDRARAARREQAAAVLDMVGIGALADRLPGTLSGGEQQRVALARALASRPRYLFLDEPFASIDLPEKTRLLAGIARLADQENLAILMVTHDPLEALTLCHDGIVLENGHLIESGDLRMLLNAGASASETVRAFRMQLGALKELG